MKYALKITRDTGTNAVSVHQVFAVRSTVQPYRLIYRKEAATSYAESLRVFDNRKEAETAYQEESMAAEFSTRTPGELDAILREDIAALRQEGFPMTLVCKFTDVKWESLRSYLDRYNPPNPRVVAKIHLLLPMIREFRERTRRMLPLRESAGGTCVARAYPRAKKYT